MRPANCGLVKVESGSEPSCVEKQPDKILDGLVRRGSSCLLLQLGHDGVLGVDLHGLLGDHVRSHGIVMECLCLHDAFHVGKPTVLGGSQHMVR